MTMVLASTLAASETFGQTPIVQYNFNGATGAEDSLAADAQPANARFYFARRGSSLVGTAGANYLTSNNWPVAFTPTAYVSVAGKADPGYSMTLTSLAFTLRHSASGPATFEVRSSLDNYTAVLKTITIPTTNTADVRDSLVLGAAFANLTNKVDFRIFGYNASATSTTGTGRLDKVKFYGTIQTTGGTIPPTVGFASSTGSVMENVTGGTTTVAVNISNPSATTATTVDVSLGTGSTATLGTDFTFTGSTLTWAAGDNTPKTVTVTIIDDAIFEGNETIVLDLTNASTGAVIGTATFTLTITDNEIAPIPTVTVASITVNDPVTFLPLALGTQVKLIGTLYGVNQRTTGLQLTLIDNTGGVGLFTTNAGVVPTVAPVEGDRVRAIGTVAHFNGLTQLTIDSIVVLATNQPLVTPTIVNGPLTEAHESELITIANPVSLVTPSQWTNTGTGFTAQVTDGTNIYDLRIVATSNIFGTPAPTGTFVLTGIGGQFDNSNPHDSGYQIIPRRLTDLRNVTGVSEALSNAISIYPNPASTVLNLNLGNLNGKTATISVVNALGQVVKNVPAAAQLNVANLPAGVYTLKVAAANGTAVKRFVKID